jgi:hypothetical protein
VRRLEVILFGGSAHRVRGDVVLVPLPEDERPVRGEAGVVDWRLNGKLSELVASGFCSGAFGEAALIPGANGIMAERVLLFGLGPKAFVCDGGVLQAFTLAGGRLVSIRAGTIVLALPECLSLEQDGRPLIVGLARAMTVPRGSARMRIVLPGAERSGRALRRQWSEITADLASLGVAGALEDVARPGSLPGGSPASGSE